MASESPEVLIAGAGPTGLVLAIALAKQGVRVRIIDKTAAPGTTSRALAVQARTLELYRPFGLTDEVVRRGLMVRGVNMWNHGEHAARIEVGMMGRGESPYPFVTVFPQDQHERLLVERLAALGVEVERQTELVSYVAGDQGITAQVRLPDGTVESCSAAYLAGCDGARSLVRGSIHAEFPGGTYEHMFYVADILARGPVMNKELHIILDQAGFLAVFPLAAEGCARLVGTVKDSAIAVGHELSWDDIDRTLVDRIGLEIERINWFSSYHVHHRVAGKFRKDRVFLLGDAAHIHSPVGGQGMNTGIGDAINLAWKLACVLGQRAHPDLLDTYEPERMAFARKLVATTDRVFQAASSAGKVATFVRSRIVPRLAARVTRTAFGRRMMFRLISQTGISYRQSAWSEGHSGSVHAGDRLPWVMPAHEGDPDNFAPLASLDWQAHVYGQPPADLAARAASRGLALHVFPFDEAARHAHLRDDQVYLVRPDGYIGLIAPLSHAAERIEAYLDGHGVRARSEAGGELKGSKVDG